jgi:hypothetical protein
VCCVTFEHHLQAKYRITRPRNRDRWAFRQMRPYQLKVAQTTRDIVIPTNGVERAVEPSKKLIGRHSQCLTKSPCGTKRGLREDADTDISSCLSFGLRQPSYPLCLPSTFTLPYSSYSFCNRLPCRNTETISPTRSSH